MKNLMQAKNISLGYQGKTVASGISFTVEEEDFLCIVGHNGAGKSTLLRTILKLQPLLSGSIEYNPEFKTKIGYLPQQTEAQKDFPASVREIILSGFCTEKKLLPFYTKAQKMAAHEKCILMGMEDYEAKCFRELSGGQKQRVLLARALCAVEGASQIPQNVRPVLILDEPTASLDPEASELFNSLLLSLNRDRHITVMEISHDMESTLSMAKHILHVSEESFFGTAEEYRKSVLCRI